MISGGAGRRAGPQSPTVSSIPTYYSNEKKPAYIYPYISLYQYQKKGSE